jgi:hypothetical protein
MKSCLRGIRRGPRFGHVLAEGLGAGVKRWEASGATLPSDLCVEVAGVAASVERSRTVPAVLPPPHTPHDFATRPRCLLDAHRDRGAPEPVSIWTHRHRSSQTYSRWLLC